MVIDMPAAPLPRGSFGTFGYSDFEIEKEAIRLQIAIKQPRRWSIDICRSIAPLTMEINRLKKEKDVFLIAHTYQTPDITYGVADSVADSYALSKEARDAPQKTILFSSVRFMAET
ncbi:MAG TPA: quinolinate synthase NadA, partial [Candidatus Thalassarchaeaceae archaeon]|nr:quinolinate synthase NadA [Candidatus Thalassarchaeaceae archaeon]